ncbi:MAG: 30S ribosomal protein S13 [Candidatus Gracilibacteria bacterium]|nr:30S ribosomal protein S13 [Candidatus Gracilibacteria bacterium]
MARIAGINLPMEKRIEIGLTYIYGIGRVTSNKILREAKINPDTLVKELSEKEQNALRDIIAVIKVEGDLKRDVQQNIKRLQEIGSYRGFRHLRRLPARGQRTKTNARTKRGKRVTVGSGKIKAQKT